MNKEENQKLHKPPQRFCFCQSDLYKRPSDTSASHTHRSGSKTKTKKIPVNMLPDLQQNHNVVRTLHMHAHTHTHNLAHLVFDQLNLL